MDVRLWPTDKETLAVFCINDIDVIIDHFKPLLEANKSFDFTLVKSKWIDLKMFIIHNMCHLPTEEIWPRVIYHFKPSYPNFVCVLTIMKLIPVSNSIVERCFSTMQKVKCDWRNRLGEAEVDCLLRIKREGPEPGSEESEQLLVRATKVFFQKKNRRSGRNIDSHTPL